MSYPIEIYSLEQKDSIKICIDCIDKCNYSCYYCYNMFFNHVRTNIEIDFDKVLDLINLFRLRNPNKRIITILIGGEPTFHSRFIYFIKKLHIYNNVEIISFTNFSRPIDFYKETISKYNIKYLITFHYLDEKRTKDFLNKITDLLDNNFKCGIETLNIMLLHSKFSQIISIFDLLYKDFLTKIRCNLIDLYDNFNKKIPINKLYSIDEIKEYLDRCNKNNLDENVVKYNDGTTKMYSDIFIRNNNSIFNFRLWQCDAGLNYIYIKYTGDIYPCGALLSKSIGNIHNLASLKLHRNICTSNICPCEFGVRKNKIFK